MKKKKKVIYNEFTPISKIIDSVARKDSQKKNDKLSQVWDLWDETVGSIIAKNTKPYAFKKNTLLIKVENSIWTQHLQFSKNEIIQKLNDALKEDLVEKIEFTIGAF